MTFVRWLRLMGWLAGSFPAGLVVLASASVSCQLTGQALALIHKEDGMAHTHKPWNMIRQVFSALLLVAAGVGGNVIAGWLPASA